MIRAANVSLTYENGVQALRNVSVAIEKGEFVFIVGATGTGKSTFLKLINREVVPTSGAVVVAGREVARMPHRQVPALRRHIGVVFQDFRLLPYRTVGENIAFALHVIGMAGKEIRRRVPVALDLVGLAHKADAFPHQLSGGEQQRASIARAIVNNPPILLADEPTGNLDPETSWEIVKLIEKINLKGTTVLVASHDHAIVDRLRRRVVEFEAGAVVRDEAAGRYRTDASGWLMTDGKWWKGPDDPSVINLRPSAFRPRPRAGVVDEP
jgi:cell division transport system ATP-binding protein